MKYTVFYRTCGCTDHRTGHPANSKATCVVGYRRCHEKLNFMKFVSIKWIFFLINNDNKIINKDWMEAIGRSFANESLFLILFSLFIKRYCHLNNDSKFLCFNFKWHHLWKVLYNALQPNPLAGSRQRRSGNTGPRVRVPTTRQPSGRTLRALPLGRWVA